MKVDLCVFLAGNNLNGYVPLFFESLKRNCTISDLCIHVVEKGNFVMPDDWDGMPIMDHYAPGVGDNVHNYLLKLQREMGVPFEIYEKHDPREFFIRSTPYEPSWHLASDHANTMHWAMSNCGTNNWIIFAHSDVIFMGDIITSLIEDMKDIAGMLGVHSHIMAINRYAYQHLGIKFNSISAFYAVKATDYGSGLHVVRHINDPECIDRSIPLFGWDTGELLRLIMIAHGWKCDIYKNEKYIKTVWHGGSGHGYGFKGPNERLDRFLQIFGISRI